ncbi:hypothetical protein RFI_32882, partial [Reticulomyxa filosa]
MLHKVWMKMLDDLFNLIIVQTTTLINTNAELLKRKLKCIFLVGGFSQSEYLRKRIADEFAAHYHIFVPRHMESVAPSNVLKATNSGVSADHIQNHKFTISDGQEFVNSCFDVFVHKGEEIKKIFLISYFLSRQIVAAFDVLKNFEFSIKSAIQKIFKKKQTQKHLTKKKKEIWTGIYGLRIFIAWMCDNFMEKTIHSKNVDVDISICDLGDQKDFSILMPLVCSEVKVVLFAFDLTANQSLHSVKTLYKEARKENK